MCTDKHIKTVIYKPYPFLKVYVPFYTYTITVQRIEERNEQRDRTRFTLTDKGFRMIVLVKFENFEKGNAIYSLL